MTTRICAAVIVCALAAGSPVAVAQQAPKPAAHLTSPKEAFGFNIGDDYRLADYTQLEAHWKKLAAESPRLKLVDIGLTAEGRHQWMAIITSPENHRNLAHYQRIAQRLAHAEGVTDAQARALASEGKTVVWVDGGLHASEVAGSQQLMQMVWEMVSRNDPETLRFLHDTILLCVPANPDGLELVANWYMREKDETKRTLNGLPRLYHKYIGHDVNRDSLTSNMPETTNMNRILFTEWNPQIMYNHHQSGPQGEVIFIPPFRDPVNHNLDSLVTLGIQAVGTAMHTRLVARGMGGSGMRTQANYDGWWNGGIRNTATYHNTIGILTEIIGNPTPMELPLLPEKQLAIADLPLPVPPQTWHFRRSIEYSMETNRAILDYASRERENLLFNIWRMGMNSIERGNADTWTITPKRVDALRAASGRESGTVASDLYQKLLHDPQQRDARAYIVSADQADFPTAVHFINMLLKSGITVLKSTAPFEAAGKKYPAGSYVVKAAQAFRPMIRDMFEPQDHPHDAAYPGGPPVPPYDIAGWTMAMQMGVDYDRVRESLDGPFVAVKGLQTPPPSTISGGANPAGYVISHRTNNSFILTNRLLQAGAEVYWLTSTGGSGTGAIWVPASAATLPVLQRGAKELGISVEGVAQAPGGGRLQIRPVRIGLADVYGGSMPSGWTRWLLEQFEFPFTVVYPQALDAGDLKDKFDVLIFPDGLFRRAGAGGRGAGGGRGGFADPTDVPEEYRSHLGRITEDKTIPRIKEFAAVGGTVIAVGSSTGMAELLGVTASNHLVESGRPLPRDKFYIPGSLVRANIANTNPLAYGMPQKTVVFFDNSPVFKAGPGITPVAWFADKATLESGWAWGQEYLDGGVAVAEASVGTGKVFMMGPEVTFRGEPHATFKLMFNGVLLSGAAGVVAR
jgi:hypothetical protein